MEAAADASAAEFQSNADSPSEDDPVALSVSLDRDRAGAGETVTLKIAGNILAGWHIYAVKGPTGVARPTRLELTLPESMSVASPWTLPLAETAMAHSGPESRYSGNVLFAVPLAIDENATSDAVNVQCEFHYQACKDVRCLPPTSKRLDVPLAIVNKKDD